MMRVLFLGNHTVGIRALETIGQMAEVVGVVAHPLDPEDGVRYLSVYDFALQHGWNAIRCQGKSSGLADFIGSAQPDLVWITDYRYILPAAVLSIAPLGVVNLHPSLLPKYRGRASINWAILQGEKSLGLTAHFVDAGMDTGDIIAQATYELSQAEDVGDALQKLYPLYVEMTRDVLGFFQNGGAPRTPQDDAAATAFPRRRPEDGLIDWQQPLNSVWNLIRAVASPYPGAFTRVEGEHLTIWKARASPLSLPVNSVPGTILDNGTDGIHIVCGDGVLLCTQVEYPSNRKQATVLPGMRLGA